MQPRSAQRSRAPRDETRDHEPSRQLTCSGTFLGDFWRCQPRVEKHCACLYHSVIVGVDFRILQ